MNELKLIDELNAENGSFILELRTELNWNHNSFINLVNKLNKEFKNTKNEKKLDREIACGIWYISNFIKDWSQHKNFPKKLTKEYYAKSYELINDLAYQYFMAESIDESENTIEKKIEEIKTICQQRV
ncbi:hypothetical protein BFP78_13200 [Gaetbulibacter sp. 5U11]|nr:hypothetical protein BFP78_13200 [Gaetbulibacter sp. 5U11]